MQYLKKTKARCPFLELFQKDGLSLPPEAHQNPSHYKKRDDLSSLPQIQAPFQPCMLASGSRLRALFNPSEKSNSYPNSVKASQFLENASTPEFLAPP
jgi:hypothetical protein